MRLLSRQQPLWQAADAVVRAAQLFAAGCHRSTCTYSVGRFAGTALIRHVGIRCTAHAVCCYKWLEVVGRCLIGVIKS